MKGARCRVLENGELVNKEHPYADGSGAVPVKVRASTRVLELEWAPPELPLGPGYPYRKQYYLDLGDSTEQGVHRRLHNLGFSSQSALDDNIRDFQRAYLQPPTGRIEHVQLELASFHDDGTLPPLPRQSNANAKSQLAGAKGPAPIIGAPAGPSASGGKKQQGAVTAVQMTELRIHVRTRSGRALAGVDVDIGIGTPTNKTTDPLGFVKFKLTRDELDSAKTPGELLIKAKLRHHGPEPRGANKVIPGAIEVTVHVDAKGFSEAQPDISLLNPSTPGMVFDDKNNPKQIPYLDLMLRDACMNRAEVASPVTRRLSADQVQKELMFHHVSGTLTLAPTSELQFTHDQSTGEFDACTDSGCTLVGPAADRRIALKTGTIGSVTFFHLQNGFVASAPRAGDVVPGQRFLREKWEWKVEQLHTLDQRHVVGLVRLCERLHSRHQIVAIYTQGVNGNTTGGDTHDYGLALDFGGCATELPEPGARTKKGDTTTPIRMGVDFIVFFHWGRVPMWNPRTVAANPAQSPSLPAWKRFPETTPDPGDIDYRADPKGTTTKLHYRLDPAPYQDPVPPVSDPAVAADLATIAPHFRAARALFQTIYDFAVDEYSDSNDLLGPLPAGTTDDPTPIDDQRGHFILHPDYAKPNASGDKFGRQAHVNHHHFQLGPTRYKMPDGKTPKPRTT
jgi:hypothetical protein